MGPLQVAACVSGKRVENLTRSIRYTIHTLAFGSPPHSFLRPTLM